MATAKAKTKIEARELPLVVVNEDGQRYAIQLVDELPADVPVLVQIRQGIGDPTLAMMALKGAALLGYMPTSPVDFERTHPATPINPYRMRLRVLSGHHIVASPEEEVERQRREAEERRKATQERLDAAERERAEAARRAKLEPLEREAEDLRAQLEAERAERERLAAELAARDEAEGDSIEVDVDEGAGDEPPAASAAQDAPEAPAEGEGGAMQELDFRGAQGEAEAADEGAAEADAAATTGRRRGARQR